MLKKKFLYLFSFFILFSLSFSSNLETSSNLITGELENGLKYYILQNKKPQDRASLNLIVKSGSLSENPTQKGLAHFLEHMAFNGTKKYKKNDLIKYLQSLGLTFGGDLNAYTSFEETVYELKIPSDIKDLKIAADVLYEWSTNITLNQKDIDDEKNIILEEWRLSQGITKRVGDIQKNILFGDSFYSKRYPIGDPNIIKSATKANLMDFYKNNYQPKNMAVVAVGDFNSKDVAKIIDTTFNKLKNTKKVVNKTYKISSHSKNTITYFSDPEITKTNVNIMWKYNSSPIKSEEAYKDILIKNILNSIINSRLSDISLEKSSPFVYSTFYNFNLNKETGVYASSSLIKNDKVQETIDSIFKNIKDISLNGVKENEFYKEVKNIKNNSKFIFNNRESITNDEYLSSIRDQILKENTFLNISDDFNISNKLLENIKPIDIKNQALNIINDDYDIFITSNKSKASFPSKDEINKSINNIKNNDNLNLNISWKPTNLISSLKPKGNIVSENNEKLYKKFELSNGLQVLYKQTDFEKDKIYITLIKGTGSSNFSFEKYINSIVYPSIISSSGVSNIDYKNLNNYFKGKNFSVTPFISDYSQGFNILTNKENLTEALNFFTQSVYSQNLSPQVLSSLLDSYKEIIKNQNNSPTFNFKETYLLALNNHNPRRKSLTLKDLDLISLKNIKDIHSTNTNFDGYNISIIGSIDETHLKEILENYFANLPVKNTHSSLKELGIKYPQNIIKKEIIQGTDKKSTVVLTFPYKGKINRENKLLYKATSNLLNTLLLENIREKKGGVYSISSFANISKLNYGENYLQIYFNTDPQKTKAVISDIFKTIKDLQNGKFDQTKIKDLQTNYNLAYESSLKTNDFWLNFLNKKNLISDYEFYSPIMYNNTINFKSIVNFSKKSIDTNNYIEVILLPQRED